MEKIVFVTRVLQGGGAERVIMLLVEQFVEMGLVCSIVTIDSDSRTDVVPKGVNTFGIGKRSDNSAVDKIKRYAAVRKLIKKEKPDIVLSLPEDIGIFVIPALLGTGIPVVVSERNNPKVMPYKKITRILRKLMYPFVDGIIFQTSQARDFFPKSIQKKGIILPNPLNLTSVPPKYRGQRRKVIVSAGRLDRQKNFTLLIEAFTEVYKEYPEYKLIIYGEGMLREKLEREASVLPEGTVELPGVNRNLLNEIRDATAFVLSSDYEGVPNVLIEAMACGIPVVSTDCEPGGAAVLIDNMKNGILVPTKNKEALAKGIKYIISESESSEKMSEKAMEVKEKHDSRIVAAQWIDYLRGIKRY